MLHEAMCVILALMATSLPAGNASAADRTHDVIAAALADPARPATDTVRDANRRPAETLAFAGIKRDDKIADYAAGAGYFTRLFAGVAGPRVTSMPASRARCSNTPTSSRVSPRSRPMPSRIRMSP